MIENENSFVNNENIKEYNSNENVNERNDVINYLTYDFTLENVYNLDKNNSSHLMSISYNNRQKMFILLDACGLITWEWRKINNSTKRVLSYPDFEYKHIVDVIYCKNHNCYFGLKGDSTLTILSKEFLEICTAGDSLRSILCMNYNPITDELITCGVDGIKIWYLKSTTEERWVSSKPMASYRLVLKKEMNWINNWIKRIEVDIINCHLYCCTRQDLYIYDFNGNLIRIYKECHRLSITSCIYSQNTKLILTGSEDTNIKVWSLAGGLIEVFRGHTNCVTNLVLNPHNSNLVISSSLDGTIKMWSLDIMELIYDLNYFNERIIWMGLTEDKLLYAASPSKITMWSINNFVDFWALSRDKINNIKISYHKDKSTRVITASEDNTIRIFNRDTTQQLTTILPIPKSNNSKINSLMYSRNCNILYLLLDNNEIWLYFTKTNPATHICIWNTLKIQENKNNNDNDDDDDKNDDNEIKEFKKTCIKPPKPIQLSTQNLLINYRAIDYKLFSHEKPQVCNCICIIESPVVFYNEEGPCSPIVKTFLLLGLQNGNILFCDAFLENKKYFLFVCNKDPIIEMNQDYYYNCLITKVEQKSVYCIQYWSLPYLVLKKEFYCTKQMTSYARIQDSIMVGYSDGAIDFVELMTVHDKNTKAHVLSEHNMELIINRNLKFEHKEKVEKIDACQNLKLFFSCSFDGCIKIWSELKHLITEISLDTSLSYASFLNNHGDLIIGWHNNLFFIYMDKILPKKYLKKIEKLNNELESESIVSDDSSIIEDPSLKVTTYIAPHEEITLNSYLYPFKIKFNTDGWINIEKKNETEKNEMQDLRSERSNSTISTIPMSLYSTPRTLDDFLPNVDLTLNSKVKKTDLKTYLVEILSNSIKNQPYQWKFPKFGQSPMSTPESSRSTSLEPVHTEEINEEVPQTAIETKDQGTDPIPMETEMKKIQNFKKKTNEEEMERKLRERLPVSYQSSELKNARIDSKKLLNQGLPIQQIQKSITTEEKKSPHPKLDTKNIYKRPTKKTKPSKPKQYLAIKEIKLSRNQSFDDGTHKQRSSRLPSLKKDDDESDHTGTPRIRKKSSISSIDGKKLIRRHKARESDESEFDLEADEDDYYQNDIKQYKRISDINRTESNMTDSIIDDSTRAGTSFALTDNLTTLLEQKKRLENETPKNKNIVKHLPLQSSRLLKRFSFSRLQKEIRDVKSELRNVGSVEPSDDSEYRNSSKTQGRRSDLTGTSQSIPLSELDPNFPDNWDPNRKVDTEIIKEKTYKIEYSKEKLDQIGDLFSYFYGLNDPPRRIKSASVITNKYKYKKKESESVEPTSKIVKINEYINKKKKSNETVFNYFDSLLEKYQLQRHKFNARARSAQIRRENLQDESLRKWSESIKKKSIIKNPEFETGFLCEKPRAVSSSIKVIDVTFGNRSLLKRDIKSATSILSKPTNSTTNKKRPKSVTFSNIDDGKFDESFDVLKVEELNIQEQPTYLISAIEMEEILEEAATRALYRSRSRSSVTTIPSIYYKHLSKIQSQKQLFDSTQESIDQIYTISGTDTSDDFNTDSEDESVLRKHGRLSYLSSSINQKNTSSILTFDSQNKHQNKNLRINSCIVDYRSESKKDKLKDTSKFESLSSYRISLKSVASLESTKKNKINRKYHKKEELCKNESENNEFNSNSIYSKYRLDNKPPSNTPIDYRLKRTKSPASIPSKCRSYKLIKYPEMKLKYKIPGYPECYLLPIRFPKLHTTIISNILHMKTNKTFSRCEVVDNE